jgi:alpha-pyrone synthase
MNMNHTPGMHPMNPPHVGHPPHPQAISSQTPPQFLATIESIATGTPPHVIPQVTAAQVVANLPNLEQNRFRIDSLYRNTRIETRHLALNLLADDAIAFTQNTPIHDRMDMYQQHALPLAETVVRKALASAVAKFPSNPPIPSHHPIPHTLEEAIRLVVFVTSTGFIAPGIDTALIQRLGLRRDVARVTVNFMGCAAAMNGLRVASDHVRAHPTHKALVVCLELSSVNAVFEDDVNDLIIHSIFGDGCAAVVVGACPADQAIGQVVLRDHFSHLVENTEDGITLGIRDNGITCKLSRQLPHYIATGVDPVIARFLHKHHLTKAHIDLWAIHPGGTRIIENAQRSLGLDDRQVADSWAILRQYGNMLSASILFVLERMLNRDYDPIQEMPPVSRHTALTGIAFSFSPGVGIEGLLFQKL